MPSDLPTFLPPAARAALAAEPALGCGNYLFRAAATSPAPDTPLVFLDRPLMTAAGPVTELSLSALRDHVERVAAGYHARGVSARDPVGIYLTEGVGPMIHYFALTSLGAIAVEVNGAMRPEIAVRFLARVGVTGLVTDASHLAALTPHLDPGAPLPFVAIDNLHEVPAAGPLPATYPYRHADEDPVMICHSSGTTGVPKAVTFAHQQFFHGVRWRLADTAAARPERLLSALPHSHSAGVAFPMLALLAGNPVCVMSDRSGAHVAPWIASFRPTLVAAFPETHVELSEIEAAYDRSSVRAYINTGDAAHERHIRRLIDNGAVFIDGLGSSEMGFSLFHKVHTRDAIPLRRSVGRPHPWVEVAVLDDDGTVLPPGRVGKLGVRAPTITPGYWNDSLLTVRSRLAGYWLTGDLVYRNDSGEWIHVDRVPDAIKTASGMVYSLVAEELLQDGLPDVEECSVIGTPAGAGFQGLLAVVRPRHGTIVDQVRLRERANELLAAAGMPALIDLAIAATSDIPTGPTGKVLKRELRDRYAARPTAPSAAGRELREGGP
jgi:acyl-coenzyme A synthetase/AMP-(fatty) acid ligase